MRWAEKKQGGAIVKINTHIYHFVYSKIEYNTKCGIKKNEILVPQEYLYSEVNTWSIGLQS